MPATISARPASTASSRVSCRSRSSTAYPQSASSGNTATATPSSWQARACSRTVRALAAGSATVTGTVHAATRAKPWSYAEEKSTSRV